MNRRLLDIASRVGFTLLLVALGVVGGACDAEHSETKRPNFPWKVHCSSDDNVLITNVGENSDYPINCKTTTDGEGGGDNGSANFCDGSHNMTNTIVKDENGDPTATQITISASKNGKNYSKVIKLNDLG